MVFLIDDFVYTWITFLPDLKDAPIAWIAVNCQYRIRIFSLIILFSVFCKHTVNLIHIPFVGCYIQSHKNLFIMCGG